MTIVPYCEQQDRHRRRRHRVRARPLRHGAGRAPGTGRSPSRARPSCWPTCGPTSPKSTCWCSICGCRMPAGSSWCGPSARSTAAGCRSWSSAARSPAPTRSGTWPALGVAGYVNEYSAVQHILPSLAPHLFPDNFNRRGSPRVVLGIPVAYRFGNTIAAALTLNLSKGGVAIRTMSPLEQHAKVRVRFRLPGSKLRHRSGVARRLERPPRRHGPAVREGRSGRPGGDRRVRRPALLHEPEGVNASCSARRSLSFPQQAQRVGDDDQRRAHVGDHRHPQRRDAERPPAPGTRP